MLSVGGFAVYRSVTRGAEDNAAKTNVDRVLAAAEDYWQQFALDRNGIRAAPFEKVCNYVNSQFTIEDDLVLRSMATVAAIGTSVTGPSVGAGGPGEHMAKQVAAAAKTAAACPAAAGAASTYDIAMDSAGAATAMSEWQHTDVLLGSTRGVFIAPAYGYALPAGTDLAKEAIVVGEIAPNGSTFCAVKVFDADDRSLVGNYRYAKQPDASGNPVIPVECADTGTGATPTETDASWPPAS